jgi:Tfp pilus assembly protein PilO
MTRRDRILVGALGALALVVAGWLLFIAPQRRQADRLGAQIQSAQRQLRLEQAAVLTGEAARRQYRAYYTELARLGTAVPSDDDVPALIVQLQRAARSAGVDFRSLVLGGSTPGGPPTSTTTTSPSTGTGEALPPGVSLGPSGLPEEPFTLSFAGSFFDLADFLGRLQRFVSDSNNRVSVSGRLMTLGSISLQPGPSGFPQITAAISATTYLVPTAGGLTSPAANTVSAGASASSDANVASDTPTPTAIVTPIK